MSTVTTPTTVDLLRRNLHAVFGQRDQAARRAEIERIWHADGVFIDPEGRYAGVDAIDQRVAALHLQFADFSFSEKGVAHEMHGTGRLDWGFGPAGRPAVVTGIDVAVARDGKLVALYAFIDAPGQDSTD